MLRQSYSKSTEINGNIRLTLILDQDNGERESISGKKTEIQSLFSFVHHGKNGLIVAES